MHRFYKEVTVEYNYATKTNIVSMRQLVVSH